MGLKHDLIELGFETVRNGGNCVALFRFNGQHSDVITDLDGADYPEHGDWLWVRYAGDWSQDIGDEIDQADSLTATRRLTDLVAL
jgi:hypothetical protein